MSSASLKLSNISKTYPGVRALDDMSIECMPGEIHAILGENGSGKSTLLGIASGSVQPDGGQIEIMGNVFSHIDPTTSHAIGLSTVYQDDSLVRELSAAENLYLGAVKDFPSYGAMRKWAQSILDERGVDLDASTMVGDLNAAQRQLLEITKALIIEPKVLLLDEPTSTLDIDGVKYVSQTIRDLASRGTAIIYVSHRLPEILDFADRVTILRDGINQGTFDIDESVSEKDLVTKMIGREVSEEFPDKRVMQSDEKVLSVNGLSADNCYDVTFSVKAGEIVGFAGAEGNGQVAALRALVGLNDASGDVQVRDESIRFGTPSEALKSGLLFLSSDRSGESIYGALGVRENMMVQVLNRFSKKGIVSRSEEEAETQEYVEGFKIVTSTLDQPISGLSGGNQQKVVASRAFLYGSDVVLIDEPTQGVDAGARIDIYNNLRTKVNQGSSCVISSSDAMELAGLCDRVYVFSRGRIIRELVGDDVTEEKIVSSFLLSKGHEDDITKQSPSIMNGMMQTLASGNSKWWVPLIFLSLLIAAIGTAASLKHEYFLSAINFRHLLLATAPLAIVAMAQFNVILIRGFDISVGSMMSLIVVVSSYLISSKTDASLIFVGVVICLLIGLVVGAINGWLTHYAKIGPIVATIAMLSVLQGIALLVRPTPGGLISTGFNDILRARIGGLPASFFVLIAIAIAADFWLHRSRSGLQLKSVGFREEAAKRNGVKTNYVIMRSYILAAVCAAIAGLFLGSEVGVGHPTVGSTYTLASIAAAVIGGAALTGGRGSFISTLFGALFFALIANIVSLFGFNTAVGIVVSGALTLIAVFMYSGLKPAGALIRRIGKQLHGR